MLLEEFVKTKVDVLSKRRCVIEKKIEKMGHGKKLKNENVDKWT